MALCSCGRNLMFSLFLTWEVAFLLSGVFNFLIVNQWSIFSSSCFTVQILPKLFHFEHAALAHFDTHGRYVCVWCVCVFVVTTAGDNIDLFDLFLFWKHDLKLFLSVDHKHVLSSQAIAYFQHLNHQRVTGILVPFPVNYREFLSHFQSSQLQGISVPYPEL